jgi:branched-chain amino acid transport system ATP-binding protein
MSVILEAKNLVKNFGGLLATDHVNLTVKAGEIHAIIGPNGAGKTTLIGQLTGEIQPDSGQVLLLGQNVSKLSVYKRARRGLGRSYQITQIVRDFSAIDNVILASLAQAKQSFSLFSKPHADHRDRSMAALAQVGLAKMADVESGVLAHGEHRQLEIAMALVSQPKVLLLDEPLAGMSAGESEVMITLLQQLKSQYPMLLIEHDMGAVFALADRISVLVYGKIIACDTPDNIRHNADVKTAYLGEEGMVA